MDSTVAGLPIRKKGKKERAGQGSRDSRGLSKAMFTTWWSKWIANHQIISEDERSTGFYAAGVGCGQPQSVGQMDDGISFTWDGCMDRVTHILHCIELFNLTSVGWHTESRTTSGLPSLPVG